MYRVNLPSSAVRDFFFSAVLVLICVVKRGYRTYVPDAFAPRALDRPPTVQDTGYSLRPCHENSLYVFRRL